MKSSVFERGDRRSDATFRAPVTIRVGARFQAGTERVFNAWIRPEVARRWLFATAARPIAHVEIDARAGGAFRFVERRAKGAAEYRGKYVEIVPHRRVAFSLELVDRTHAHTSVVVEIERRSSGSRLVLTHDDVPHDLAYGIEARWTGMLYGLGVTLDSVGDEAFADDPPVVRRQPLRRPALAERGAP